MVGYTYSDRGWNLEIVDNDLDLYHLNKYRTQSDALCIKQLTLDDPKASQLVKIGEAHLETLKTALVEAASRAESAMKDYESKFLLLETPDKDELS